MTHKDRGHYSRKHSVEKEINPEIVKAVKEKVTDGALSCASASKIAEEMGVSQGDVGFTLDMLEIRIIRCQMGIFGYEPEKKAVKPMEKVPVELEKAIRANLTDGKLTCISAWGIAKSFGRPKMDVSSACERLGIKIKQCQLGAF